MSWLFVGYFSANTPVAASVNSTHDSLDSSPSRPQRRASTRTSSFSRKISVQASAPVVTSRQERVYGRQWEVAADFVPAHQTSLTIEHLNPGFGYRVRVFAQNVLGWGPPSIASPLFRLPVVPRLSVATRSSLLVKWSQPFFEFLGPRVRSELADIAGSGSDSERDYGLQHTAWMPDSAQHVYRLQCQMHVEDEADGCMIWRPFHR